ncbi:MAG: helicase-related protein [Candidatus Delongbacteria bacterium]|jgi:superfamily II DNA/RNA helicase|nr:helicase-related protein [Candidatus Delongbacteria bacterium]
MTNFITNSEQRDLKKRLTLLIKNSKELKFLVGFFYFSGIKELYEGMKKNPDVTLDILVGLNVDSTIYGLTEYATSDTNMSREEVAYNYFESLKRSINTETFDNELFYKQIIYFINLIKDDRLRIRKTLKPNHSKLYVFKLNEDQVGRNKLFITGSSNLTGAGLSTQEEFNVEISDYGVDDAEKYFNDLWDNSDKITEDDLLKQKLLKVLEDETVPKKVTPFEAFVYVIKTYLDSFEQKELSTSLEKLLEDNGYTTYLYQLDAVKQALSIIDKQNGVIIADVVGLGKSIIASCVAKEIRKRGMVICPPGLIGDRNKNSGWKKYLEEFQLYDWEVRSSGNLESAAKFIKKAKDIEVVIIDEAHRFRNQDTKDYEFLKNICRDKKVMLLTATPFNNRPADILSLLKLFINPKKSTITLEDDLTSKFIDFKSVFNKLSFIKKYWNSTFEKKRKKAEGYFLTMFGEQFKGQESLILVKQRAKYLSKQIRDVIEPVTIRRNRLDLKYNPRYKNEIDSLSTIADPFEWFFKLDEQQSEFYDEVLLSYFAEPEDGGRFTGAIYQPFMYETKQTSKKKGASENLESLNQKNLFDFMRRMLVKRFESSFGSFKQSIINFKNISNHVKLFIEKSGNKFILDRTLMNKIYNNTSEDIEKELEDYKKRLIDNNFPKNHKVYDINKFYYKNKFLSNIDMDIALYDEILEKLDDLKLVESDPKSECLINNIALRLKTKPKKSEPKLKVLIFSEYKDTVEYLEPLLLKKFGKRLLTVKGNISAKKFLEINENFDASYSPQVNDFDILLTTDKLSEGFNLNRAGMIVNYDIPWNPVRVIQRVGRINRISKKVFSELNIVNFFPTLKGSELVKSREIAANKMFLIHNTLGEDSKIFDIDEEPTPSGLYDKLQQNPEDNQVASFYTRMANLFEKIKKEYSDSVKAVENMPPRVKTSKEFEEDELFVFMKKGRLFVYQYKNIDDKDNVSMSTLEDALSSIECEPDTERKELSPFFWTNYEAVKNFKEVHKFVVSELSIEQQAINNLNFFIKKVNHEHTMPFKNFFRTLLEDINDFGTLSDFTQRRIANLSTAESKIKETVKEIKSLIEELGEDYLLKEKQKRKKYKKEIIISIENRKL